MSTEPIVDHFSLGFLIGILAGEGHFGGDGKQPQITLRMHIRHEQIFRWLLNIIPGSKLYGPYNHSGRQYFQWMVRGEILRKKVVPMIADAGLKYLDPYTYARFLKMTEDYKIDLPTRNIDF